MALWPIGGLWVLNYGTEGPERLRLSVEVRTGSEFDENTGTIKRLTQAEWLKRQARLWKECGGSCDVRTWDQVSDAEKQQLRHAPKTR